MNSQHRSDHREHLLKVSYLFVLVLVAHMDQQKQLSHNCHERMNRNANRPVNFSSSNHLLDVVAIATTKYGGDSKKQWTVHGSEIVYPEPNVSLHCCLLDTIFKLT